MSSHRVPFVEGNKEAWTLEREQLLAKRISDLGLKIEGTYLQQLIERLYAELDRAGIRFKPRVYLSDEWSCPDRVPIIGIPFYLADPKLLRIEDEMMDGVEAESEDEILGYLRHEAGHAFNYAYKLYETAEWRATFGPFELPYNDEYTPQPFSRSYVRHIPGWYAQKHPDEDFSETFAVWLNPSSDWRRIYRGWGCYPKLEYIERIARECGPREPVVSADDYAGENELGLSLAEYYRRVRPALIELPAQFDTELARIFARGAPASEKRTLPADAFIAEHRRRIVSDVAYWTGLYDVQVRSLVNHLIERCKSLGLRVDPERRREPLIDFTAFVTALCMNKLYKGDFVIQ